ncbi:S-adenosyl-L-methionine-dependent methyltransferase [Echria macrotheca]|uniref:S-adenosyl-L-methionine-dependent methyltransferase n=1 Tax=Echria macrotheca TaxID=438768 RepID=A0AAJ0F3C9_9PEZI|nr:S-adenosyl-L-methionine-dependent methyltransferase [Echria macrotheca]
MADLPIEVDAAEIANDGDSAIEERITAYTASLTSGVTDYPIEHGRRYHAFRPGVYAMPNDEKEMDRLDLIHHMMIKGVGDKYFLAPIPESRLKRILDIGTGTGIWAIEMGDQYPGAEVIGNDLSPIQPEWVPPNVKFEVDDVESPWMYAEPFDFIYCRYMAACIADWPKLMKSAFDNLNPGGWAEFQDYDLLYYSEDDTLKADSNTMKWLTTLLSLTDNLGRTASPGPKQEQWVKDAGFQNVVSKKFRFPIGPWPKDQKLKELGICNLAQILDGLEAFSLRLFCDVAGWTVEEVNVLLAKVRQEVKDPKIHMQFDFYVTYGQKPE